MEIFCPHFLFLFFEYNSEWNHITYVPDYIASGLPAVARRDENLRDFRHKSERAPT
jgi:hypothetical protein